MYSNLNWESTCHFLLFQGDNEILILKMFKIKINPNATFKFRSNIIIQYVPDHMYSLDENWLTLILLTTTIVVVCSSALGFHSRIRVKVVMNFINICFEKI